MISLIVANKIRISLQRSLLGNPVEQAQGDRDFILGIAF